VGDKFGVKMSRTITDRSTVWSDLRVAWKAVIKAHPGSPGPIAWQLSSDTRTWDRSSLNELQKIAEENSLVQFSVYWSHSGDGLLFWVQAHVYEKFDGELEIDAFAGRDRMATDRAVLGLMNAMKRRGLEMNRGETKISSSDDGTPKPTRVRSSTSSARISSGRWSKLMTAATNHLAGLIITVAGTVIGAAVIVWWGIGAPQ
jgi:hypothetical protein